MGEPAKCSVKGVKMWFEQSICYFNYTPFPKITDMYHRMPLIYISIVCLCIAC